ncbi:hypothetical protein WJX74_006428 [Apatococcus lobatus]|uniref:Uncharacterized protein n=1 Tax=Apatococcus lobatus TaxID=904363 RepID=A0AAW1R087_9CHLO
MSPPSTMASIVWQGLAGASKRATVIPGHLEVAEDEIKSHSVPTRASVSFGGAVPLSYTPYADQVPATKTVGMVYGAYGSVAAAQDVCAADLRCLGVKAQDSGPISLLYPGCSAPRVISDLRSAPGTTTWVKQR